MRRWEVKGRAEREGKQRVKAERREAGRRRNVVREAVVVDRRQGSMWKLHLNYLNLSFFRRRHAEKA